MRKVPYEDRLQRMLELRQMRRMTEPCSAISSYYFKLFQKSVYDLLFRFGFGQSQSHQFNKLIAGDLADSRFVEEFGVQIVGFEPGNGKYPALVHNYRIAFGVAVAWGVADDFGVKFLIRILPCDRARYDVGAGIFTV